MFTRAMQPTLEKISNQYPVVVVTGPRQSGKTTFVKAAYPTRPYYNLEHPDVRALIEEDPQHFFAQVNLQQGIILDEIQNSPNLLSYIQVAVDNERVPGAFILTGSHQLQLTQAITQSLAGRVAILELLPLSISELNQNKINYTTNDYLLSGFFPGVYQHHLDPITNMRNYIKTYVERDVRQIINVKDLHAFQRFIKLCAGRIGSTINYESLGNDVGITQNTIKNWLSILETSYISFQLQPYYENFGKRIIKAAKHYFTDTGIASYLLDIKSTQQVDHDKLRGALFENMVILEIIKYQYNHGSDANIYFFRDNHGNEVDVLLTIHDQLIPIEIKSSATFQRSFLKGLHYFQKLVPDKVPTGILVYAGEHEQQVGDFQVINYKHINQMLGQLASLA